MTYFAAFVVAVQAGIVVAMLVMHRAALRDWKEERSDLQAAHAEQVADLCQRIQAPDHAVIKHFNEEQPEDTVRAVNEFIDDDYWPTRDELADKAAEAEVNGSG